MSEDLVRGITLDLDLSGRGQFRNLKGRVVAFSNRLNTILVPEEFIRWSNKWWADGIKAAEASEDADARRQVLVDSFYLLRVACLLMHPVVPVGCEKICDYLSFDFGDFFSWNYDFDSNDELCPAIEIDAGAHRIHELPPRFDFFRKHESQYK